MESEKKTGRKIPAKWIIAFAGLYLSTTGVFAQSEQSPDSEQLGRSTQTFESTAAESDAAAPLTNDGSAAPKNPAETSSPIAPVERLPHPIVSFDQKPEKVRWKSLILQSTQFLTIETAFRYATEPGTRSPHRPFFRGYLDSVTNLHGWADGNPFLDNYIGHPIQGAVSGFIWIQNDPRYRNVVFGRDPEYWKSRLRAGAFAWAYGTLQEIGPISEASIGNIQSRAPEYGFVDHVITPAFGLGWLIAEDILDRYVVRHFERKTNNRVYRVLLRGGLNPTRSFANVMAGRWPWDRLGDESERFLDAPYRSVPRKRPSVESRPGVAPFDLAINSYLLNGTNGPCIGGGATVAFRVHSEWQIVGDLNGCKMNGLETNLSGDSMTYVLGPRWTPMLSGRWHPYFQVLGGGSKVTQELFMPELKAALEKSVRSTSPSLIDHSLYTRLFETAGPALVAGAGVDYQLNNAFSIRMLSVDYTKAWVRDLPGFASPNGIQVKAGLVLHTGTW
jgi:hypothetical protein